MEFQPTRNGGFQSHGVPQIIQTKCLTILVLKPMVTWGSAILRNPQMDPNGCLTFFSHLKQSHPNLGYSTQKQKHNF